MKLIRSFTSLVGATFTLAAAAAVLSAPACGSSASSLCDDVCECVGCSEPERSECEDSAGDAEKVAEEEGCTDQFDEYVSCVSDQFQCREGEVDADGCDSEAKSLGACMDGPIDLPGGGGLACDDYRDELLACCDKLEGESADQCRETVEKFDFDDADDDACQAAADAYECPID